MIYVEMAQAGNGHDLGFVSLDELPRVGEAVAVGGFAFEVVAVVHRAAEPGEPRLMPLLLVNPDVNPAYGRYLAARPAPHR